MIGKAATLLWFAKRPSFWPHAASLVERKVKKDHDTPELRSSARRWAAERACSIEEALAKIGFDGDVPDIDPSLIEEGERRAEQSPIEMGGAGDLRLLHAAIVMSRCRSRRGNGRRLWLVQPRHYGRFQGSR